MWLDRDGAIRGHERILAIRGKLRPLFFLWALVVTYYLIKGYFLGGYRFTPDGTRKHLNP